MQKYLVYCHFQVENNTGLKQMPALNYTVQIHAGNIAWLDCINPDRFNTFIFYTVEQGESKIFFSLSD